MSERNGINPRIVVGVDGSPSSLAALQWAARQAGLTGGTVKAVMAWHYPATMTGYGWAPIAVVEPGEYEENAQKALAEAVAAVDTADRDVEISTWVQQGNPAQVLIDAAADADLLVVGSRGHGGFAEMLLGSVSMHCVHHAACPVTVIRFAGKDKEEVTPAA
jgi:nucleotide-binding universal stress UspA family protein